MVSVLALGSEAAAQRPAPAQASPPAGPRPVTRSAFMGTIETRFAAIDTNHDGSLSNAELATEQQKEMQQARSALNQQLSAKFKQLDTNKDGQLSVQEFLAAAPALRTAEGPDQIRQRLDTNKDGKVSLDEFRTPEAAKFDKADANHDGTVTPAEMKAAAGKK
jgi:hypothetical protein